MEFKIGKRKIGDNYPPVIIAEIGINHNGSLDNAISLVDSAIKAGAEIVKHQTHIPYEEMSEEAKRVVPGNSNKSIFDIIQKCTLNEASERKLMNYVKQKKRIFISTPFSTAAADRLYKFGVPAFKIGSGECNNFHFIKYLCKFKLPIIMSTGMNSLNNLKKSIQIIQKNKIPLALLHCTNIYPTAPHLVRLGCINEIKQRYPKCIVGLSDHTETNFSALGAVALGARIIEKHFTDKKERKGPDIICSMDTKELGDLIKGVNIIYEASVKKNNQFKKRAVADEKKTIMFAFQSVVSLKKINAGDALSFNNIGLKRPGTGFFKVKDFQKLIGRRVKKDIKANIQIKRTDLK